MSGLIVGFGILAIIAGIIVLVKPKIIAWIVGIYLILGGVFTVIVAAT
jgi:uncharacterized membrane protein HdeD (DUF308 family)